MPPSTAVMPSFTTVRGPAGANQIILDSSGLRFAQSDVHPFGRGRRLDRRRIENGPAVCAMTDQAPMVCRIFDDNGAVVTDTFW
ncbi:MAG TPA: hypothetical protein VFP09_08215 [Desertimonas sp.]|nr:hypothetical protein [Desertimonas sp.]